jgi:hypothetical protein
LLNEGVLLASLKCRADFVASELFSADCLPHRAMLEELPGLERFEMSFDDAGDGCLSDFFGLLSLEPFILLDERCESFVTDKIVKEKMPDCVLVVHVLPLLVGGYILIISLSCQICTSGSGGSSFISF